jgi:hypothetical protein
MSMTDHLIGHIASGSLRTVCRDSQDVTNSIEGEDTNASGRTDRI